MRTSVVYKIQLLLSYIYQAMSGDACDRSRTRRHTRKFFCQSDLSHAQNYTLLIFCLSLFSFFYAKLSSKAFPQHFLQFSVGHFRQRCHRIIPIHHRDLIIISVDTCGNTNDMMTDWVKYLFTQ